MDHDQLCNVTLTELGELIRTGEISPVEVVDAQLARIERHDPDLKSYILVLADEARAAAQAAEREIQAGNHHGPLHGVPVAVKDLCAMEGTPTKGGAAVLSDNVTDFDSEVVARLKAAGAIIIGKLNLTEGAMGGYNPAFEVPRNPWNHERWSGASSSGSGVATAAGLCFGSLGSDTGGSIRFPSAACGVVGLKPTWGRVSRHGVLALAESLDHVGPMTRSTSDAAAMFQAIAGYDPKDPTTRIEPVDDPLENIAAGVQRLRIGYDAGYTFEGCDAEQAEAVAAAVEVMAGLGAEIVEVEMPDVAEYLPAWQVICTAEAVAAHEATYPERRDEYGPWFRGWLDLGSQITGVDYARANTIRAACNGLIRRTFENIDALICPSTPAPAHPITMEDMYGPIDYDVDSLAAMLRYTGPFDFNGAPTLSVPAGLSSEGLPLSVQFVGHHLGEALLCRIGYAYEQATEWHRLRPPVG